MIHKKIGLAEIAEQGIGSIVTFWTIIVTSFFVFSSQNIIAPNLNNIGLFFQLSTQKQIDFYIGGIVPFLLFFVGGLASIYTGALAQKYRQIYLFLFFSLSSGICSLFLPLWNSIHYFYCFLLLAGAATGGFFPLPFALISELFSEKSKFIGSAYLSFAIGLGIAFGQFFAGYLGNEYPKQGWRYAYLSISLAILLLSTTYLLIYTKYKQRINSLFIDTHPTDSQKESIRKRIQMIFRKRTNTIVFVQGLFGCIPWGVFSFFLISFYENKYAISKILATSYALAAGGGMLLGTFLGGLLGQKLYNRKKTYLPLFMAISILFSILPIYLVLHQSRITNPILFAGFNMITGFIATLPAANINGILMNSNTAKDKSLIFALLNILESFGRGFGPFFISIILLMIPNRELAFKLSLLAWIPTSILWLFVSKSIEQDSIDERVQNENK
ncbi:MAG: MFS transporter [Spirochaetota bacterium]